MTRLAIFTSHPIQYQAPWFSALAARADLTIEVFYSYIPDANQQGEGFGKTFTWDIPLLEGYPYTVLETRILAGAMPAFARRMTKGIVAALDRFRPDVAMILGWHEISLVQALLACKLKSIPVILRGESNALRHRPRIVEFLHRRYFKLCDAFLAIGRGNADLYRQAGVAGDRIVIAGYFVDNGRFKSAAERFHGDRNAIRHAWDIPQNSLCVAFVGKLEPKKCVLQYLEGLRLASARGASVHGLIVGTGIQMDEARQMIVAQNLPVTMAGFLNQTQISRAYVAADVIVLPSDFGETWGLVVNEAMASGLPAIVSNRVGAANDLVIDNESGFVFDHADVDALAVAICALAKDEKKRHEMGRTAQNRVFNEFSIEIAVERTLMLVGRIKKPK